MKTEPELWQRISAFVLDDDDADLPFSKRLARDNGWTGEFTTTVLEEYKRFLYLASVSREQVTPSGAVDQAWHLHLTYSRSYWLELCAKVLRSDLHHGPTAGGETENKRYHDQYENTLALYRDEFGHEVIATETIL